MQSRLFRTTAMVTLKLMLTAALFAQPVAVPAQQDPPSGGEQRGMHRPPSPAMQLERLSRTMQNAAVPLTDAQKTTILGILEDRETAMKALRNSGATGDDAATQRDKLMASSRAAIRATLSEGQARVFDAMPSGPPQGGPPPSGGGGSAGNDALIDANTGGDPHTAF